MRSTSVLALISVLALAGTVVTNLDHAAATEAAGLAYVVGVEGMSCPIGCAPKVQESLKGVVGVDSVDVNFEEKNAVVRMTPGETLTQKDCEKALDNSGYFVSSFAQE